MYMSDDVRICWICDGLVNDGWLSSSVCDSRLVGARSNVQIQSINCPYRMMAESRGRSNEMSSRHTDAYRQMMPARS